MFLIIIAIGIIINTKGTNNTPLARVDCCFAISIPVIEGFKRWIIIAESIKKEDIAISGTLR